MTSSENTETIAKYFVFLQKRKTERVVFGRHEPWKIYLSICLGVFVVYSLLSLFWLNLREPQAVKDAIVVLEQRGFIVKGKNVAVNPLFYELGWSLPDRYCFNFERQAIRIEPIEELKNAFEVVNPTYVVWRSDPSLGDRELTVIQNVKRLRSLDIADANVTDTSFPMLMKKSSLEYVVADNTRMTKEVIWEMNKYRGKNQMMCLSLRHCILTDVEVQRLMKEYYGPSLSNWAYSILTCV